MDNKEEKQVASELQQKIANLTNFEGESLKDEMASLKRALLANPSACMHLLDEDIGLAVASLRRMTGIALSAATVKTSTKKPKEDKIKKLSATDLEAALNAIDDEDF